MSTTVSVSLAYEFEVKASAKDVFALLSDVPKSASHYPGVKKIVDLGSGSYRWEMNPVGVGELSLQTVYASHYVSNKAKGSVTWTPVEGVGNALVSGSWTIKDNKKSTHIVLDVHGDVQVPVPALMKIVVTPLVEAEFERLTEHYIDNLIKTFGGEV